MVADHRLFQGGTTNKKDQQLQQAIGLFLYFGRCERIRTFDPLHPMQVRYQAAPHTDLA